MKGVNISTSLDNHWNIQCKKKSFIQPTSPAKWQVLNTNNMPTC